MRLVHPEKQKGKKIVIVVGGGFAGLNTAHVLAKHPEVHVLLLDQRNHHLFQPLLYQVATAELNPADIAVPIRAQFPNTANVEVHLGRLISVMLKDQYIVGSTPEGPKEIEYDYLVIACGSHHSYFTHPEWESFAPGLKTLEQAIEIRRRILLAFETAENELDPKKQESLLNFVIVGGGPTGVELAGAISDISQTVLVKDFRRIDPSKATVTLVEAGPRILPAFADELSNQAMQDLKDLGVEVRINTRVENIDAFGVKVGEDFIQTKNVFWAAGVQAASLDIEPAIEKDRAGRVKVQSDFSLPHFQNVFVIGDMAAFEISPGKLLPGLAPAAIQAGKFTGHTILADLRGEKRVAFKYNDKGQMATIGKSRAIAQTRKFKLTGYIAWLAWLFVHIFYLIDFKNRIFVMSEWIWSYIFSKRGARLITERE